MSVSTLLSKLSGNIAWGDNGKWIRTAGLRDMNPPELLALPLLLSESRFDEKQTE
jgi:hypothetical protein